LARILDHCGKVLRARRCGFVDGGFDAGGDAEEPVELGFVQGQRIATAEGDDIGGARPVVTRFGGTAAEHAGELEPKCWSVIPLRGKKAVHLG
jgi:hypothetical protein